MYLIKVFLLIIILFNKKNYILIKVKFLKNKIKMIQIYRSMIILSITYLKFLLK